MAERIPVKEIQKLEQSSGLITLYEIELSDTQSAYFTRSLEADLSTIQMYDHDTNNQLNSYIAIPLSIEGTDVSSQGPTARPVITFSNVLTDFENAISPYKFRDLVGKKLYRRRTFAKYIKGGSAETSSGQTPIEFPRQMWIIDRVETENAQEIGIELASPFNTEGLVLPYRVVGHNACPWQYQGASPEKTESNKRGGCTWHSESKYIINGTTYQAYVNSDDEYVIPSTTTFTAWSGSGTADSYYSTTTTLGTSSGIRRYNSDGTIDTDADSTTVTNYWQAVRTTSTAPSDTSGDWTRIRIYENYSSSTTYYTYTDDKLNMYAKPTSGTEFLWQAKITHTGNSPQHGVYWLRGDLCGKRLKSCQCRYGFNPLGSGTGKATKKTDKLLPFGGFPGARKFK